MNNFAHWQDQIRPYPQIFQIVTIHGFLMTLCLCMSIEGVGWRGVIKNSRLRGLTRICILYIGSTCMVYQVDDLIRTRKGVEVTLNCGCEIQMNLLHEFKFFEYHTLCSGWMKILDEISDVDRIIASHVQGVMQYLIFPNFKYQFFRSHRKKDKPTDLQKCGTKNKQSVT